MKKFGILAGTFDPVHNGHIDFALEAIKYCALECVYFMPERIPRQKQNVTDFSHREKMLELATMPYGQLNVQVMPELQFTVSETLPKLQAHFAPNKLVFLLGSDVVENLGSWPGLKPLIIGLRNRDDKNRITDILKKFLNVEDVKFIKSAHPEVSSRQSRVKELKSTVSTEVYSYTKLHNLYG